MLRRLALLGALVSFPLPFVGPERPRPPKVLLVVGEGPLREGDELLQQRLTARGYEVTLVQSGSLRKENAGGAEVLVLAPSVSPVAVARLGNAATPLVVLSALAFPSLAMSVDRPNEDFGVFSGAEPAPLLVEGDHPLTAGLSGQRVITTTASELGWAIPTADAVVIARSAEHSERAVLFAYDAGAYLVSGPAPGRRVGFGLSEAALRSLRPEGWRLLFRALDWGLGREITEGEEESLAEDAHSPAETLAPVAPTTAEGFSDPSAVSAVGPALFVVGSTTLTTADNAVKTRLQSLGYTVTVRSSSVPVSDATGKVVIVISSTVSDTTVAAKFRDTAVPVVTWERLIFDDMAMVVSGGLGTRSSQRTVAILDPDHPLAGGMMGTPTVTTTATTFNWGRPSVSAVRVGGDPAGGDRYFVFGYETNAAMVGRNAPARRVGLFLSDTTASVLTAEGWAFFDAAVSWATNTPLPQVATPTFSRVSGTYPPGQSVTVSVATSGATIRYTLTGDDPTPGDPVVASGGALTLGNYTLKAKAWKPGYRASDVQSATYSLSGPFTQGALAAGPSHSLAVSSDGTWWWWGTEGAAENGFGQPGPVPRRMSAPTGVTTVAAGGSHSLVLKSDGTVWAMGDGRFGQLGDGTTTSRTVPAIVPGLSGVTAIAATGNRSLALKGDGTLLQWGENQLTPAPVAGLAGMVITVIAAGDSHTLALRNDGRVLGWGENWAGQLGTGTTDPSATPVLVSGLDGVVAIAAGAEHSLAVRSDGAVFGWGGNTAGQAGQDPAQAAVLTAAPIAVASTPRPVRAAAGQAYSLVLREDGTVLSWGEASSGQLGRTASGPTHTPGLVQNVAGVSAVASGSYHGLAVASDGVVWAWGSNGNWSLGDGTRKQRSLPIKVSEARFDWKVATPEFAPSGGTYYADQTVTLTTWTPDAVIHYTTEPREPTEADPALSSGATIQVDQPATFRAKAWKAGQPPSNSDSEEYRLDVAPIAVSPTPGYYYSSPVTVVLSSSTPGAVIRYTTDGTPPGPSSTLYAGPISVTTTTTLRAIATRPGWPPSGELTATYTLYLGTLDPPTVTPAAGTYLGSVAVSASSSTPGATIRYTTHGGDPGSSSTIYTGPVTLTQNATFKARAFHPDYTQSAIATAAYTIQAEAPTFSPGAGTYPRGTPIAISTATAGATIHYTTNGADPTTSDPSLAAGSTITPVASLTLKARAFKANMATSAVTTASYTLSGAGTSGQVALGGERSIAVRPDGSVWTWGGPEVVPTRVEGLTDVTAVAAGALHFVALKSDRTVWTWGRNNAGQLGLGDNTDRPSPVQVPGPTDIVAVAAGQWHTLLLRSTGTLLASGANSSGQLGNNSTTPSNSPVAVANVTGATAIAAGEAHSLARNSLGRVWGWGQRSGSVPSQPTPGEVVGVSDVASIAAGSLHSLALKTDGTVWMWTGSGGSGTFSASAPRQVSGLQRIVSIAMTSGQGLAAREDGTAWTWNTAVSGSLLAQVSGLEGIARLGGRSSGCGGAVALRDNGAIWASGCNWVGQLGDGTRKARPNPVQLAAAGFEWLAATPTLTPEAQTFTVNGADLPVVNVAVVTQDAVIRYTTDGQDPTETAPVVPAGGITLDRDLSLKVRAWKTGMPPSNVDSAAYVLMPAMPSLTPAGGTYVEGTVVTASSPTAGVTVRYTTDGMDPTDISPAIGTGFALTQPVTFKVRAFRSGWTPSYVAGGNYMVRPVQPTLSPGTGSYPAGQQVIITCPTMGATIRYTVTGLEPTEADPVIPSGGTVTLHESGTLKAKAWKPGWAPSTTALASFMVQGGTVAAPTFSPPGGTYPAAQAVTISTSTAGATIRYTRDGSDPTLLSPLYAGPVPVEGPVTIRARAFRADWAPSAVAAATYSVSTGGVVPPVLSPPPGAYATAQTVVASSATSGAIVRYTITGLDPTPADATLPPEGIRVERSTLLKVKAWKEGLPESRVVAGVYTLTGAISAGAEHALALKSNGTAWAWGRGASGRLGNGGTADARSPVAVSSLTDVTAVAAGDDHSLTLRSDRTVWSWGANAEGQIGDGSTSERRLPVPVGGGLGDVAAIAAGPARSLALTRAGRVWQWGGGQSLPVEVSGLPTVVAIALGDDAVALAADGSVWTWSPTAPTPIQRAGLSGISHVAAGEEHYLAVKTDGAAAGTLWAWGSNREGQLGDGLWDWAGQAPRDVPVAVHEFTNAIAADGGRRHSLGLKANATAWAWGYGRDGQLGDGTDITRRVPSWIVRLQNVVAVSAGGNYSLALRQDGMVLAFGENAYGQLGTGSTQTWSPVPTPVAGLSLADSAWLDGDPDSDGLSTRRELELGTDPFSADTNGDGIPDGVAIASGLSATSPDMDGDGVTNVIERQRGMDPFSTDTDGDGCLDGADTFPLDPTRCSPLPPDDADQTPPTIQLEEPTSATVISVVPPQ